MRWTRKLAAGRLHDPTTPAPPGRRNLLPPGRQELAPDADLQHRAGWVTGRRRDGRCTLAPKAKAETVQACLQPVVSVARIGMQYGINPNLLRSWIGKRHEAVGVRPAESLTRVDPSPAFVPLQIETAKAQCAAAPAVMLRLHVRLPNGVEFDLSEASVQVLAPVVRQALRCCSEAGVGSCCGPRGARPLWRGLWRLPRCRTSPGLRGRHACARSRSAVAMPATGMSPGRRSRQLRCRPTAAAKRGADAIESSPSWRRFFVASHSDAAEFIRPRSLNAPLPPMARVRCADRAPIATV